MWASFFWSWGFRSVPADSMAIPAGADKKKRHRVSAKEHQEEEDPWLDQEAQLTGRHRGASSTNVKGTQVTLALKTSGNLSDFQETDIDYKCWLCPSWSLLTGSWWYWVGSCLAAPLYKLSWKLVPNMLQTETFWFYIVIFDPKCLVEIIKFVLTLWYTGFCAWNITYLKAKMCPL